MNAVTEVMDELRKALAELEDCRARNADLRTMLEQVTRERDEARAESTKRKAALENIRRTNTDLMMQLFDAQEATRAVNISPVLHENAQLRSKALGLGAEVDRLMHQLADATNESTHFQVMCKRETEEVERLGRRVDRLTDERDELLVRVANQGAELRATRKAYLLALADITKLQEMIEVISTSMIRSVTKQRDAYRRGAEATREACARWMSEREGISQWVYDDALSALPIPEEP